MRRGWSVVAVAVLLAGCGGEEGEGAGAAGDVTTTAAPASSMPAPASTSAAAPTSSSAPAADGGTGPSATRRLGATATTTATSAPAPAAGGRSPVTGAGLAVVLDDAGLGCATTEPLAVAPDEAEPRAVERLGCTIAGRAGRIDVFAAEGEGPVAFGRRTASCGAARPTAAVGSAWIVTTADGDASTAGRVAEALGGQVRDLRCA